MVQGSCRVPPTRIRDRLFPMVDDGAGRSIGGGSSGKTPEAMSSRILARSSDWLMGDSAQHNSATAGRSMAKVLGLYPLRHVKTLVVVATLMPIASVGGYDSYYQNGQRQNDLSDHSAPPEHVFSPLPLEPLPAGHEHEVRT